MVFLAKALLQETESSETYDEYMQRDNFMLTARKIIDWISIHQTYFVLVPLFSKPILTKQNIASTKNCQQFLASQVSVSRRNKTTNSWVLLNIHFQLYWKPLYLVIYSL